jgi:hypothetical protein
VPPREALAVRDFVEPHEAEKLAHAGDCAPQIQGIGVMRRGGSDEGEFEGTKSRSVGADEGEIDFKAFLPRWIGQAFRNAVAMGFIGELCADGREVILAVGVLSMGEEFAVLACQVRASAQQVAGGAPRARIDRRWREHPAAPQHGDFMGVDRVVFGLAAMDGLHIQGMAADNREAQVNIHSAVMTL